MRLPQGRIQNPGCWVAAGASLPVLLALHRVPSRGLGNVWPGYGQREESTRHLRLCCEPSTAELCDLGDPETIGAWGVRFARDVHGSPSPHGWASESRNLPRALATPQCEQTLSLRAEQSHACGLLRISLATVAGFPLAASHVRGATRWPCMFSPLSSVVMNS